MTTAHQKDGPTSLSELMSRVRIKATSPDGSVTAIYTGSDGTRVSINERSLADHSDTSLSEALTAAVHRAVNGAQHAHGQLREIRNGTPARQANAQTTTPSRPGVNIKQYSPRRYLFVVLGRSGQLTIHLRPRAISALHHAAAIEGEVNAALTAAYQGVARQRIRHV